MSSPARITMIALLYSCLGLLAACSDGNDNDRGSGSTQYLPISLAGWNRPRRGEPQPAEHQLRPGHCRLRTTEYFLAAAPPIQQYQRTGRRWALEAEPGALADYRIRVLVYRPLAETGLQWHRVCGMAECDRRL